MPFSFRERIAHPHHIDFLITADRFIGSKQIARFGNVSIAGLMVGALPREGARGKGLVGKRGMPRPSATRRGSLVLARLGPPVPLHFGLGRLLGSSRVQHPLAAGRAGAQPPALPPYHVQPSPDSFVKLPLRPPTDPESRPGPRAGLSGLGQLGPTSLASGPGSLPDRPWAGTAFLHKTTQAPALPGTRLWTSQLLPYF